MKIHYKYLPESGNINELISEIEHIQSNICKALSVEVYTLS